MLERIIREGNLAARRKILTGESRRTEVSIRKECSAVKW
jgi:hypothetical protein